VVDRHGHVASIPGPPVFPSGTGPRGGSGSDFQHRVVAVAYLIGCTRRSLTTGLTTISKWIFKTFLHRRERTPPTP
jgi:hypothetical protein